MRAALVLFTRDLRIHDHPALAEAAKTARTVLPVFVFDDQLMASGFARPNRVRFLLDALADLDLSLGRLGAGLVVRRGHVVEEVIRLARDARAEGVFSSADVSGYAQARERHLERACEEAGLAFRTFPGTTVVPPETVRPTGGDHFRVFTPFWRKWQAAPRRPLAPTPRRIALPKVARTRRPRLEELVAGTPSPEVPQGGETEGRRRLAAWLRHGLLGYGEQHDDLAGDGTSRLSPYLHFGCLSPLEVAARAADARGAEPFLRQLCWRDFAHQVTRAFPAIARAEYRPRGDRWRRDAAALAAWKAGRTGYPIVDAGMRQLAREGWMHNRARLITASFLVKDLYVDWRLGAAHFLDLLVDGDIANNFVSWQWVAGTGNDTRPNRVFNPITQAKRFDPEGAYVRRYVQELAGIPDGRVHEPWRLDPALRSRLHYPPPIVDHAEAVQGFRARRRR